MTPSPLGRLTPVDLRDRWIDEATEFTPWLARPENLDLLAKTLGIELELEAQERPVGPFRADILCKDIDTDTWVLVENQLERTDHRHLGQLLTYASGLQAVTIVWIAANFTDEHRATLDWLNSITDERFRFFGLEVELWRIGDSLAAPKFNVVSKPNEWSRPIDDDLSETRILQREYWTAFQEVLARSGGPISGNRKPQPKPWMRYPIGRAQFSLGATMIRPKNRVRAELRIKGANAKAFFGLLREQRDAIEQELGYALEWEELPELQKCRVASYLDEADPEDWPRQHEWLATRLKDLHRVFAQRVKALDADDWHPDEETEAEPAVIDNAHDPR